MFDTPASVLKSAFTRPLYSLAICRRMSRVVCSIGHA